jgi:serine protease inhibitor ecotin
MPRIRSIDVNEARSRLQGRSARDLARAPYREAISRLTDATVLELTPDADESMRTLKLRITQAAKDVNRHVAYGVSDEGTLLVWLERPKRRRRRRVRAD